MKTNQESSRHKKSKKKSKKSQNTNNSNSNSNSNSKDITIGSSETIQSQNESYIPPSNHKPSLPFSSFASWEQAFQSVAQLVEPMVGVPSCCDSPLLLDNHVDPATNTTTTRTNSTNDENPKQSNCDGFRSGDLKKVSLIAKSYSHGGQDEKEIHCNDCNTDDNHPLSTGTNQPLLGKRKLEQTSDEDNVKNNDRRKDGKKKRQKKEKRSSKKSKMKDVVGDKSRKHNITDNVLLDDNDLDARTDQHVDTSKKEKHKKQEKRSKKKSRNNDKENAKSNAIAESSMEDSGENNTSTTHPVEDVGVDSSLASPLEGQVVMHQGQTLCVLVEKNSGIVYSMEDRSETGGYVPIGKVEMGKIVIDANKPNVDNHGDNVVGGGDNEAIVTDFPFAVDPNDHCESPLVSYRDIRPMLDHLAKSIKATSLAIYDPFYCNGLIKEHLLHIGYSNVYNRKEDAYKTWDEHDDSQTYPNYDVFITNPPYSGDHPERLIRHLTEDARTKGKPWFLLMPQYIHKKEYYTKILFSKKNKKHNGITPFYLVPKKRYVYLPPKDFREKKASDVHKKSSPFVSMWYIWGGSEKMTEELIKAYERSSDRNCELARSTSALRDLRRKKT